MARVLILFAHPAFEKSRVHRRMVEAVKGVAGVTFHDLYEAYPDFDVDIRGEQQRLAVHELVVLQHPLFWYSTPALLKQWEDLVLEHGWAYGTGGDALRGKRLLSAITTGGGAAAYGAESLNRYTIRQFLAPLEQTARLCGMEYLPPFVVHGTHRLAEDAITQAAQAYRRLVEALRDDRLDLESARGHDVLPSELPFSSFGKAMHDQGFFFQAFVYLSAAVVAVPLANRLGLGSVLGYLLAGAAIGPFGLRLVGAEGQDVMRFAEFGVVMMLFLVGLELEPSLLYRLRREILGLGTLQVVATSAAFLALGLAFGLRLPEAAAMGMILSLSSTALVLQSLAEKGRLKTTAGQSAFAVLLFQDLAVIPMLAFFPLLATALGPEASVAASGHGSAAEHAAPSGTLALPAWGRTLVVLLAVTAVVAAGRYVVRPALRAVARTHLRELFTAAALLLVIGIALLMTRVGLSPALGTFLAGVVLATSEYRHELVSDVEPFKGLLLGLFFIAVGASIDFGLLRARPGLILGLVAAVLLVKLLVLAGLARAFGLSSDQGLLFAFSLPQVGEFAFVLLSFAASLGLLAPTATGPLVATVALTMAASPLLVLFYERILDPRLGVREKPPREADVVDEENPVIIAGFGRFGNIAGRLLRANGVSTTVLDNDSDRVFVLRRLGLKVFYGDATRHDLLEAAGAAKAKLLILALDDPEKNLELVHTARKHFPNLTLLARALDRPDAYALMDAGVKHVYRETFDTSLRLGVDALRLLGRRGYQAQRAARAFHRHDEAALDRLRAVFADRAAYLSTAREVIADLERTLQGDLAEEKERDAGWDTDTLRQDTFGRPPAPPPDTTPTPSSS